MTKDLPKLVRVPSPNPEHSLWRTEDGRVVVRRVRRRNLTATVDGALLAGSWSSLSEASYAIAGALLAADRKRALGSAVSRTVASVEYEEVGDAVRIRLLFADGAALVLCSVGGYCDGPGGYDVESEIEVDFEFCAS